MSILSSVDLVLRRFDFPPSALVREMITRGWTPNDDGRLMFVVREMGDWQFAPLSALDGVLEQLDTAWERREDAGIVLLWQENQVGGELVFFEGSKTITFIANINRMRVSRDVDIADVTWYLARLVPPLQAIGGEIERWGWDEF